MNDPLMIIALAEVILFLASFGLLFSGKEIGANRKRVGIILFTVWVVVLAVGVTWGIVRKFS